MPCDHLAGRHHVRTHWGFVAERVERSREMSKAFLVSINRYFFIKQTMCYKEEPQRQRNIEENMFLMRLLTNPVHFKKSAFAMGEPE